MLLFDKVSIDVTGTRTTSDGYLVASPRVARTGIQKYAGSEVGKPSMPVVRVYRPEAEVFHSDAMRSLAYRPITNNHPATPVTADNWKEHSVGASSGEVVRDGEFIRLPMMLSDAAAIKAVKSGKAELSVGYHCDVEWTPGTTPSGEAYDAVQKNIRANHIAVVDQARGGSQLRIGDSKPTDAEVIAAATAARDGTMIDATHQRPRSGIYDADQQCARDERQLAYDRRISEAWRDAPYPHLTTLSAEERQMVAGMAGRPAGQDLAKLTRKSAEEMHALANRAEERMKVAQHEGIKKMSEESAAKFRRRALQLEAEAIELETPVVKKDAASLTEDRVQAYRKRISDAWKQPPPPVTDGSKLGGFMSAMAEQSVEAGFKAATAAGDPPSLEQARARADDRLRNAWRNPA